MVKISLVASVFGGAPAAALLSLSFSGDTAKKTDSVGSNFEGVTDIFPYIGP